jgi:hypothetical protein
VAYGQNRYVMVGDGVIGHSDDGLSWTFDTSVTSAALIGVLHVRDRFITLDSQGFTYYSTDGIHWDSPNFGGYDLNAVTATASGFLAVGPRGTILSSTNGADWKREASGTREDLGGVDSAGGLIFATGNHGTILSSPDGHTWTQRYSNTNVARFYLRGVTYARGRYVATGAFLTSSDGLSWRAASTSPVNRGIQLIDDGSQFLVATYPDFLTQHAVVSFSRDGLSWTIKDTGLTYGGGADFTDYGPSLAFGRGLHVMVGDHFIATSADGTKWIQQPAEHALSRVIYAEDGFVTVGQIGYQGYSGDGAHWVYNQAFGDSNLSSIAYRNGVYVAVGAKGRIFFSRKDSLLRLTPKALLPGLGFHLTLRHGRTGQSYTLQGSENLRSWSNVGIINNFDTVLAPTPPSNAFRFYRAVER